MRAAQRVRTANRHCPPAFAPVISLVQKNGCIIPETSVHALEQTIIQECLYRKRNDVERHGQRQEKVVSRMAAPSARVLNQLLTVFLVRISIALAIPEVLGLSF